MLNQVSHSNGIVDTQANDPDMMGRPSAISAAKSTHTSWSTFKDYIYRGTQLLASSHSTEGTRQFHLDHLGTPRLVTAAGTGGDFYTLTPCRVLDTRDSSSPLLAGETRTVAMSGLCGIPSGAAAVAVNITAVDATAQGEMTAYPANEARPTASVISYQPSLNRANNAILKLGNGALAFFNNQLSGNLHLIIDVNGYFTEDAGAVVAYHVYYPFGEEATAFNQDAEQMKFTGHERDLASVAGAGDDLDYMHARHCSPLTGRFLSVDPAGESFDPKAPQSWNRFTYVQGHPLGYTDPSGKILNFIAPRRAKDALEAIANQGMHGYDLVIADNGTSSLQPNNEAGPPSPEQAALAGFFLSTEMSYASKGNRMRLLALGITALFCIVACHAEPTEPMGDERARDSWIRNEMVIQRVIDGDAELNEEFMGAWRFFRDTIGIVVRLDGDYSGLTLTADSKEDFDLIRDWYENNSHRLYWDELERAVRVKAPPGPAGAIWWHHESVLLDLIAGETVPERQRTDTRNFFLALTGIDVFTGSRGSKNGLVPAAGPQTVLTHLRLWYRENGDNLVVNPSSGKLERGEENSL